MTDRAGSMQVETLALEFDFGLQVRNTRKRAWGCGSEALRGCDEGLVRARELLLPVGSTRSGQPFGMLSLCGVWDCESKVSTCCQKSLRWSTLKDSSMYGFSLMYTAAESSDIRHELEVREKWRFCPTRQGEVTCSALLDGDESRTSWATAPGNPLVFRLGTARSSARRLRMLVGTGCSTTVSTVWASSFE